MFQFLFSFRHSYLNDIEGFLPSFISVFGETGNVPCRFSYCSFAARYSLIAFTMVSVSIPCTMQASSRDSIWEEGQPMQCIPAPMRMGTMFISTLISSPISISLSICCAMMLSFHKDDVINGQYSVLRREMQENCGSVKLAEIRSNVTGIRFLIAKKSELTY